jgi:hypothetical protein
MADRGGDLNEITVRKKKSTRMGAFCREYNRLSGLWGLCTFHFADVGMTCEVNVTTEGRQIHIQ